MSKIFSVALFIGTAIGFSSCLDAADNYEDPTVQLNKEVAAIDAFLATSGFSNVIKDASGVRIVITELGTGLPARAKSIIDVDYIGKLFDPNALGGEGAFFDQGNIDQTDAGTGGQLSKLIPGWQIALTRLPVGSKAKLFIPSRWAYGTNARTDQQGNVTIPANSTLFFSVNLNEVILTTDEKNKLKADTTAIEDFLETEEIAEYVKDPSGIRYVINAVGTGVEPGLYNKVTFSFKYSLLTSTTVIASGTQTPVTGFDSRVVDYIQAFMVGLRSIKEGGKVTVYAPALYCFGTDGFKDSTGAQIIPANSILKIELELTDIGGI